MKYKLIFVLLLYAFDYNVANNPRDTTVYLENNNSHIAIYLKYPATTDIKGVILALPGWKLPVLDWCTKTTLCSKALEEGYILIMPEMAKSIYAKQYYTETRKDWLQFASRKWFVDTLIPYFQKKFNVLITHQNNYIIGLSTGGRGVALLCLDSPDIFKKGAALSGDYDQTQIPKDALMTGWYGSITEFPDRWKGSDNPVYRFNELNTPLYLGHGKADKIVPVEQTLQFADSLKKYKPDFVKLHIDETAGHTYEYWNSEVDAVLSFFNTK